MDPIDWGAWATAILKQMIHFRNGPPVTFDSNFQLKSSDPDFFNAWNIWRFSTGKHEHTNTYKYYYLLKLLLTIITIIIHYYYCYCYCYWAFKKTYFFLASVSGFPPVDGSEHPAFTTSNGENRKQINYQQLLRMNFFQATVVFGIFPPVTTSSPRPNIIFQRPEIHKLRKTNSLATTVDGRNLAITTWDV